MPLKALWASSSLRLHDMAGVGAGVASALQVALWQLASVRQTEKLRKSLLSGLLRQEVRLTPAGPACATNGPMVVCAS
jgi:hypothetical protein